MSGHLKDERHRDETKSDIKKKRRFLSGQNMLTIKLNYEKMMGSSLLTKSDKPHLHGLYEAD